MVVDPEAVLREKEGGTEIMVRVTPNASESSVEGINPWRDCLVVRVSAAPRKGEANEELCRVLSEFLGSDVIITRGHTGRSKTVFVDMVTEQVAERLEALL